MKNKPKHTDDDLIYGLNPVTEALKHEPDKLRDIIVQQGKAGKKFQDILELARSARIRVRFLDKAKLPWVSGPHQGVIAKRTPVSLLSLHQLLDRIASKKKASPRLLALDSIQDPGNLGALIRSALAAGFNGIILTRDRSAPLTGTVVKTSAGAVSHMDICQVTNLAETLKALKTEGYWIFGTVKDRKAVSLYKTKLSPPLCLVIGGESKGIRPLVKRHCDHLVTIPMQGSLDSLNCSAAAAVVMFESSRQMMEPKK